MFCESSKGTYTYLNGRGSLASDTSQVLGQFASSSKLTIFLISTKYKPMLSFFKASFPKCSYSCTYYTVCNWMHLAFFFMWKWMCYYRKSKKEWNSKNFTNPQIVLLQKEANKETFWDQNFLLNKQNCWSLKKKLLSKITLFLSMSQEQNWSVYRKLENGNVHTGNKCHLTCWLY